MNSVRTCLGCRQRVSPSELVRVVARDGVVVADFSARLTGRGAWVHPTLKCVTTSIQRKAFGRALRVETALDIGALHQITTASNHDSNTAASNPN